MNPLQLIWWSGTRKWNLRLLDLQISAVTWLVHGTLGMYSQLWLSRGHSLYESYWMLLLSSLFIQVILRIYPCMLHISYDFELYFAPIISMADSVLPPSQWETPLQSNTVSHWMDANLESALISVKHIPSLSLIICKTAFDLSPMSHQHVGWVTCTGQNQAYVTLYI